MPVNQVPAFAGLDATPTYVENGSAVVLDNNATVSDAELDALGGGSGNYDGAVLTLSRNGAADPNDVFGAAAGLTITDGTVSLNGGATIIGTVSQGDGTLQITFNANATSAAVNGVLQKLTYSNIDDNPPASAQIAYSFSDGNTGSQGSGPTPGVGTGSINVTITQVDDAPLLIGVATSAAYGVGTTATLLSPALGVFDPDATSPSPVTGLSSATITIANGFLAGDQLFVNLLTSGGHFITPDGDATNITVQSNASGTLVLAGQDTVPHWQSILDAVSYTSAAADPTNGGANPSRAITWAVNDGALNSATPNTDPSLLINTTILHFSATPVLDLDASGAGTGFTVTYTENGAPIRIVDTDVGISVISSSAMESATIVLTNAKAGDSLSIAGTLIAGISSTIDTSVAGSITLILSNPATTGDYQSALGQIRFANSSENPDTTDRDITVVVSDGEAFSNTAHATVHVVSVNDPPVITSNGGGDTASVSIPENTSAVTTVTAADLDSATLTYSIAGGSDAAQFQINASTGALSFIAAPDFEIPADSDRNNSYVVQVRASDGAASDNQTITVSVTNVNDPLPTLHWTASVDIGAHPAGWLPSGFGDYNNDGTSDVLWYNAGNGDAEVWKIGNGQWAGSVDIGPHPAGYTPSGPGDFNHDGTSDVFWFNPTTRDTDIWRVNNGQWAGSTTLGVHPAGYQPAGIGDFNHDGTSDVFWFNPTTNDTDIWLVNNAQWAGSTSLGAHPAGYQVAGIGDFNRDGTSDVLWFNPTTRETDIWLVNNGQWAGSTTIGVHPAGYQVAGIGDFNRDGTSDVVWYNPTTNDVDIWLVQNGHWAGSVGLGAHPLGSVLMGVGDFDHNGVSDIMWRDTSSGHIETWLLAYS